MKQQRLKADLEILIAKAVFFIGLPIVAAVYAFNKGYETEAIFGASGYFILLIIVSILLAITLR